MKQVVFNVGGALSTYIEFDSKTLLVDLGKSDSFNPINDFLLPLYKRRNAGKSILSSTKYHVDQLIISHPHNDHISAIEDFDKDFCPGLLTCPNDNLGMDESHKINWDLIDDNENVKTLRQMLINRKPPLDTTSKENQFIYYIPPKRVEKSDDLTNESYCNNISIAVYVEAYGSRILMPGDLQKLGMEYLINTDTSFYNILREGIDVLITPHHGLRSSFSTVLFNTIKGKKTRCLNIVSEKPTTSDSNRQIDTRYSTSDYCKGENNLLPNPVYQRKTSNGHIYIDYSNYSNPQFEIITDNETLINKFLNVRVFRHG